MRAPQQLLSSLLAQTKELEQELARAMLHLCFSQLAHGKELGQVQARAPQQL